MPGELPLPPLPPQLRGTDVGASFARETVAVRLPKILAQTLAENRDFDEATQQRMEQIRVGLERMDEPGHVRPIGPDGAGGDEDRAVWNAHIAAITCEFGSSWAAIPWFSCENCAHDDALRYRCRRRCRCRPAKMDSQSPADLYRRILEATRYFGAKGEGGAPYRDPFLPQKTRALAAAATSFDLLADYRKCVGVFPI
jgi:hypothetical protein